MYARMTTFHGALGRSLDESIRDYRERAQGEWRQLKGFMGATLLIDRARSTAISITFWESELAMRASEAAVVGARMQAEEELGTTASIDRYEVAVQV